MNIDNENNFQLEHEQRLFEIGQEVNELEDKLGQKIDPGIRETLIAFKAHKLPTAQSCEGHDHRGEALPWVQIENPAPIGWEKDEKKKELWRQWNKRETDKIKKLLVDWYEERKKQGEEISEEKKLILNPIGLYGAVRIESAAQREISGQGKVTDQMREDREKLDLEPYKEEMRRFGEYLKKKFLENKDN